MNDIKRKENTRAWIFIFLTCLVGATVSSWKMINSGNEYLAKAIFFWGPFCILLIVKILQSMMFKNFFEINGIGQRSIRKDAPAGIYIFFDSVRAISFFMLGYAFAHLAKYGSV